MPSRSDTDTQPSLRVAFLGSGSSGNATVVSDGTTTVLIDCGFSAREVVRRLQAHDLDATSVSAILVTHEHTDHTRGLEVFASRFGCSVWATTGTRRAGRLDQRLDDVHTLVPGVPVSIGTFDVLPFRSSHDAAEPVGYVLTDGAGTRFGLATDPGTFTPDTAEALLGCDVLGLECNHDIDMLTTGPYPWFLKQRIASNRGHLSNPDAADALERVASDRLTHVFALHLSRTNNTHDLARAALEHRLARLGLGTRVTSVTQDCTMPRQTAQQLDLGASMGS